MSKVSNVTIDTVGDEGAAEVAGEALTAVGIPVEIRRVGFNPYQPGRLGLEVRVPADRVDEARRVLAALADEAMVAADREAGDLPTPVAVAPRPVLNAISMSFAILLLIGFVFFYVLR